MAWIARDEDGRLYIYNKEPYTNVIELPSNADEKLIGKHIDWTDGPVEID